MAEEQVLTEDPTPEQIELSALGRELEELKHSFRDLSEAYESLVQMQHSEFVHVGNFFMTKSIANLTMAMAKAAQEFGDVVKDAVNPFFDKSASKGRYADLANYIEATRTPLAKNGLVIFQAPGMSESGPAVTTLLSHISDEKIGFNLPIPAAKLDAWGLGSSFSYSRRYGYGPITNVAGEDDDGQAAQASREEHLQKLNPQMEGQERISHVMANTWMKTAAEHGRTDKQIADYLDGLNGYKAATEILKFQWEEAKTWALNQPSDEDLIKSLAVPTQQALLKKLYAVAGKKHVSDDDLHKHAREEYKVESLKDLKHKDFTEMIKWLESSAVIG